MSGTRIVHSSVRTFLCLPTSRAPHSALGRVANPIVAPSQASFIIPRGLTSPVFRSSFVVTNSNLVARSLYLHVALSFDPVLIDYRSTFALGAKTPLFFFLIPPLLGSIFRHSRSLRVFFARTLLRRLVRSRYSLPKESRGALPIVARPWVFPFARVFLLASCL
jgi:hypothetical protein